MRLWNIFKDFVNNKEAIWQCYTKKETQNDNFQIKFILKQD